MEIQGKTVLVTGGASGLGAASARLMAQSRAKVVIADLNDEAGSALAIELGSATTFVKMNVVDEQDVQRGCKDGCGEVWGLTWRD